LAIIKGAWKSNIVDILIHNSGHLPLLNGRNPSFGMKDVNLNVFLSSKSIYSSTRCGLIKTRSNKTNKDVIEPSCISTCGTEDCDVVFSSFSLKEVLKKIAKKLQGNIFES